MHELAQSVLGYLRKHDLLQPGDRVGVAVSGGADSVALLRILLELKPQLGVVLSAVHVNHKLRGAESDADQEFVRELAFSHGLRFWREAVDVKMYAEEKKLSMEAAGRELRYAFFEALLTGNELTKIATAHTLDDQAETVLLKLSRGAGTRGLAGIYPKVELGDRGSSAVGKFVVRPMLSTPRVRITSYLNEIGQSWREDSSNRELKHTRNRIRLEILPTLEEHLNPAMREALANAAELARAEEGFGSEQAATHLPNVWSELDGELDAESVQRLHLALQRRLVRAAAETLGLNLGFQHVEELLELGQEGACTVLPSGWLARRRKGKIRFERQTKQPTDYCYSLTVPGRIAVSEAGIAIEAVTVSRSATGQRYNPEQLLDASCARRGLLVRNWRAGDRFWPAHTRQPKKIKEILQVRHIAGPEKKRWPVVASGDEVVWMKGFGVRRDFYSKEDTGVLIREESLERNSMDSQSESQPVLNRKETRLE